MPSGSKARPPVTGDIAIVGLGLIVGTADSAEKLDAHLKAGESLVRDGQARADEIALPMKGLRFPPRDLEQSLPQQIMVLRAALDAVASAPELPSERTAVLVGSQADPEVCRYGARWRIRDWAPQWNIRSAEWVADAMDRFVPVLQSAGVVGNMPNIPANRINSQFDFGGPGFTLAAEQNSGLVALHRACRLLRANEVDAALVGAVDLCCEPIHQAASSHLPADQQTPGDAAVVFVLKRMSDAQRDNDAIIATLPADAKPSPRGWTLGEPGSNLSEQFGHAHAASALVHVAAAALALRGGYQPQAGAPATEAPDSDTHITVRSRALEGSTHEITLAPAPSGSPSWASHTTPLDGPMLRFPAHPEAVVLPQPPLDAPKGAQLMAPAPTLPSAMHDPPAALSGPTGFGDDVPPQTAPIPQTPTAPPPLPVAPVALPSPVPMAPPVAANPSPMASAHQDLAQQHTAFLQQQAMIHQQFLALQNTAQQQLLQVWQARRGGAVPVAPSPTMIPHPSMQSRAPSPVVQPPVAAPSPVPATSATVPRRKTPPTPPRPASPTIAKSTPTAAPAPKKVEAPETATGMDYNAIVPAPVNPPGPRYDRADLEVLASDKISKVFPEMFKIQDDFPRQVRMPEPPLLLADRVTGIDAEPGSMTTGTIWTETDITWDSWYLHDGHMPAGVMIEAGQADLLLISWLGADFQNKGERVYRLLGCELTYHGGLPTAGDTLCYDIHIDGHANQGDTRIFFFHYDCRVDGKLRLAVREGQAGFFSDEELAHSGGILWTPETAEIQADAQLGAPLVQANRTSYTREQVLAFADGNGFECFGPGYELMQTHVRGPRISGPPMLFFDHVTDCDHTAGPWKRGYLRAVQPITPEDWFFDGHFKDDPCMPGTLMFEGCLHALSFYMAHLGLTLRKDGWRFEPVPDTPYQLRCRGQVTPQARELIYEVFIEEVIVDGVPTVWADFLCTVDGLKAFHAKRVGVQLTPDWPISSRPEWLEDHVEPKPVAATPDGFEFGYASLIACAWGRPSEAFGPMYRPFDEGRHCARLPGPPYHFMSRLTRIDGAIGGMEIGTEIELEYDVPPEAWYFDNNGNRTMPFAVLLEAALQPCGWIACYIGSALTTDQDLYFRNLDGTGTLTADIFPDSGTLRTVAKITNISHAGGMIIEAFDVACFIGDTRVYELKTVFGFFPKEALANQVGLTPTQANRDALAAPSDFHVDLTERPARFCGGPLRLPAPMLLMLDRVTGYWPEGGSEGLGRLRGEKDVDPAEWFFKAHFFTDPVQPGSLGLEALLQLLQFYMLEADMGAGMVQPRFEPIALDVPMSWKYRGQVVPQNDVIRSEIEIIEVGEDEAGRYAICNGYLWVDELRIYEATKMGMRIVDGHPDGERGFSTPTLNNEEVIDPKGWVADHPPTWTLPALPAMSMADRLAAAALESAPERVVVGLSNVQVHRWVPVASPVRLRASATVEGDLAEARLEAWREAGNPAMSRFEPAATGTVHLADSFPESPKAWPVPTEGDVIPDPYASGHLFHGPAFQALTQLRIGPGFGVATLDAGRIQVPLGCLNQGLLDALTHAIPHDRLDRWTEEVSSDQAAYPQQIARLDRYGALPTQGRLVVVSRFLGMDGPRSPRIGLQAQHNGTVLLELELVEVLMPKGPIGEASPTRRLAFLRDGDPASGLGLSTTESGVTTLDPATLKGSDWLPGTVQSVYGLDTAPTLESVALRDHAARILGVHPRQVRLVGQVATTPSLPLRRVEMTVEHGESSVTVRNASESTTDLTPITDHWDRYFDLGRWPVEDLYYSLIDTFVRDVQLVDPVALDAVRGRSVLYLANHQTGIESLLMSIIASAVMGVNTATIAKAEHRQTWLGQLIAHCFSYPNVIDPEVITFFDRDDQASLFKVLGPLAKQLKAHEKSVMVHIEGTRSTNCGQPVTRLGSAFVDLAIQTQCPIVPVRFTGGLPTAPGGSRLDFPLGYGRQDIWLGKPLLPEDLEKLPLGERKRVVLDAINATGPDQASETPNPPSPELQGRVEQTRDRLGLSEAHSVILEVLRSIDAPHPAIAALIKGVEGEEAITGDTPETLWLRELASRLQAPGV